MKSEDDQEMLQQMHKEIILQTSEDYANIIHPYKDFERKINNGCKLFLQAHSSTFISKQIRSEDEIWLKSFRDKAVKNDHYLMTDY